MMNAVCVRRLQFRAGPESSVFGACEKHRPMLAGKNGLSLFFPTDDEPITPVDEDDEIECYFCRGEEGP